MWFSSAASLSAAGEKKKTIQYIPLILSNNFSFSSFRLFAKASATVDVFVISFFPQV